MDDGVRDAYQGGSTPGSWAWAVCGASVTGWQHLSRGLGCDDAFGYGVTDDFVVAAVADGAGSVTGTSAWGSFAACRGVLDLTMTPQFIASFRDAAPADSDHLMRWLFTGALERVMKQAGDMGLPVAQLSTTLCVALGTPDLAMFGQIGDGIIAAEHDGQIATHLIEEKHEYANATWFLQTRGSFDESFRTSAHTGPTAFALSTDGMAYKVTNIVTGEAYEPFFTGSWQHVRSGASAADFAALLRDIGDDQTGDDKTMVLAALQWQDDKFHPSARPVTTTVVHSALPSQVPAGQVTQPTTDAELAIAPPPVSEPGEHHEAVAPAHTRRLARAARAPRAQHRIVQDGELVDPGPSMVEEESHAVPPVFRANRSESFDRPPAGSEQRAGAAAEKRRRFRPRRPRS